MNAQFTHRLAFLLISYSHSYGNRAWNIVSVVGYSIYMQGNRRGIYFGARNIVNTANNRATNIVNIVVVVVVVNIVEAVISMKNII